MALQKSQIQNNLSSSGNIEELERNIDSITNGLSRPYFNKILKELAKKNLENTIIICDYIIAEQIEIDASIPGDHYHYPHEIPSAGLGDVSEGETVQFLPDARVTLDLLETTPLSIFTLGKELDYCGYDKDSPPTLPKALIEIFKKSSTGLVNSYYTIYR